MDNLHSWHVTVYALGDILPMPEVWPPGIQPNYPCPAAVDKLETLLRLEGFVLQKLPIDPHVVQYHVQHIDTHAMHTFTSAVHKDVHAFEYYDAGRNMIGSLDRDGEAVYTSGADSMHEWIVTTDGTVSVQMYHDMIAAGILCLPAFRKLGPLWQYRAFHTCRSAITMFILAAQGDYVFEYAEVQ